MRSLPRLGITLAAFAGRSYVIAAMGSQISVDAAHPLMRLASTQTRLEQAGLPVQEHDRGFLTRDPWETAVVFTVA